MLADDLVASDSYQSLTALLLSPHPTPFFWQGKPPARCLRVRPSLSLRFLACALPHPPGKGSAGGWSCLRSVSQAAAAAGAFYWCERLSSKATLTGPRSDVETRAWRRTHAYTTAALPLLAGCAFDLFCLRKRRVTKRSCRSVSL